MSELMQTDNPTGDVIDPEDIKPLDTKLTAIIVILVILLIILLYYLIDSNLNRATGGQTSIGTLSSSMVTPIKHINGTSTSKLWTNLTAIAFPLTLVIMIIYFFCMGALYNMTHNKFRSDMPSVNTVIAMRRSILGQRIESLIQLDRSVCRNLINNANPYKLIVSGKGTCLDERALVNWRPLTVRLTGYRGGIDNNNPSLDGVFDMEAGVRHAIHLGARAFFFDIDYLEDAPWPAAKDELIDFAIRTGAPLEVVENLQDLEDEGDIYESIEEIWPDYPSREDFLFNEDEY